MLMQRSHPLVEITVMPGLSPRPLSLARYEDALDRAVTGFAGLLGSVVVRAEPDPGSFGRGPELVRTELLARTRDDETIVVHASAPGFDEALKSVAERFSWILCLRFPDAYRAPDRAECECAGDFGGAA